MSKLQETAGFVVAVAVCMLSALGAHAKRLYLDPEGSIAVQVGDQITFHVMMDFTGTPTSGGTFDVRYDPEALLLQDFEVMYTGPLGDGPNFEHGLFENWSIASISPLPPVAQLGRLTFLVRPGMCGSSAVMVLPAGDWITPIAFGNVQTINGIDYDNSVLTLNTVPPVPEVAHILVRSSRPTWL